MENFLRIIGGVCFMEEGYLSFDMSVEEELAISSVMMVELLAEFENATGVNMEDKISDFFQCSTLGDMYKIYEEKLSDV